ncbi:UDP-N-acetylenolpyruvoylglucosamine reductase [Thiosulfatimonas sediminis]|uniref:UDP-N-acetylenolpyruvoylglucosamine reductase n=1 Tax=Thiosulfatimonas sediminis TaxID=2675054 RepID=A0A6F8PV39_9GAMM|nr:UDP-N-acetylmuramate dehydrogenase [Thiosulfatimonas sediminis]BBP45840.1 UDP-N-acetylenolpyruvoylglucosamine reductase [Thiosulfatimonas sediminis]
MHIQANYSLLKHNTFRVNIRSQYYVEINKQSDILTLRTDVKLASLPWRIVGDSSNLLYTHNFPGVTLRCTFNKIRIVKEDDENVWLSVGGGVKWHDLVEYTVNKKWWGLENLALIPGTVGAAPVQNIGAYGAEARDVITRVQTLNVYDGSHREFRNAECNFGYRTSIFKQEYINRLMVYRITLRLRKFSHGQANLSYDPLKVALQDHKKEEITPRMVFDQIVSIRQQRIPDPAVQGNAGSFFKNPVVDDNYFHTLQNDYPDIPHHKMLDGSYKIPAAWLIETCGWKGHRHGSAGVSQKHALVLVNLGGATGSELAELAQLVQEDVNHKFGIYLEPEVIIL